MQLHDFGAYVRQPVLVQAVEGFVREVADNFDAVPKFSWSPRGEVSETHGGIFLPYPTVIIHMDLGQGLDSFYFAKEHLGGVMASCFCATKGMLDSFCRFTMQADGYIPHPVPGYPSKEVFESACATFLWRFLSLLNHPDQKIETHLPSQKLNAKRSKSGKYPLVEYKTLTILKPKVVAQGRREGTHASPRLHPVRSHERHYKSGKISIVKSHLRGDKSKGILLRDYKVIHQRGLQ